MEIIYCKLESDSIFEVMISWLGSTDFIAAAFYVNCLFYRINIGCPNLKINFAVMLKTEVSIYIYSTNHNLHSVLQFVWSRLLNSITCMIWEWARVQRRQSLEKENNAVAGADSSTPADVQGNPVEKERKNQQRRQIS